MAFARPIHWYSGAVGCGCEGRASSADIILKYALKIIQEKTYKTIVAYMALAIISQSTSRKVLAAKQPVLLLYKMNGCGHCMAFEPTWVQIAKELGPNKSISVAEVEYGDMAKWLPSHLHVQGFPTVMILDGGKHVREYNGMRTKDSVMEFVSTYLATKPKVTHAKSATTKSPTKAKPKSKPASKSRSKSV
jgi:thioredoxin-like negative regulator of GroEL